MALAIVLVTVVVPIVVACASMPCCQTGMMPIACLPGMNPAGSITSANCSMGHSAVQLPDALVGVSLTLLLMLLFGYAVALVTDGRVVASSSLAPVEASEPPPPPEEPLGAVLRL